jgi:hypothetical protein
MTQKPTQAFFIFLLCLLNSLVLYILPVLVQSMNDLLNESGVPAVLI